MRIVSIIIIYLLIFHNWTLAQNAETEIDTLTPPRKLTIAIKESPPFTYKNKNGIYMGISVYLWDLIAKELNIDFEYKEMTYSWEKIMQTLLTPLEICR